MGRPRFAVGSVTGLTGATGALFCVFIILFSIVGWLVVFFFLGVGILYHSSEESQELFFLFCFFFFKVGLP
jgi:hypothetical protein